MVPSLTQYSFSCGQFQFLPSVLQLGCWPPPRERGSVYPKGHVAELQAHLGELPDGRHSPSSCWTAALFWYALRGGKRRVLRRTAEEIFLLFLHRREKVYFGEAPRGGCRKAWTAHELRTSATLLRCAQVAQAPAR